MAAEERLNTIQVLMFYKCEAFAAQSLASFLRCLFDKILYICKRHRGPFAIWKDLCIVKSFDPQAELQRLKQVHGKRLSLSRGQTSQAPYPIAAALDIASSRDAYAYDVSGFQVYYQNTLIGFLCKLHP